MSLHRTSMSLINHLYASDSMIVFRGLIAMSIFKHPCFAALEDGIDWPLLREQIGSHASKRQVCFKPCFRVEMCVSVPSEAFNKAF